MLELNSISCGYGAFQAVHGLSLSLQSGTITGLLGANGAGKSSTLMCIAGHVKQQGGVIHLDGQDISNLDPTERVRNGIAISPEGRRLFKDLTVQDNLRVGGMVQSAKVFNHDRDRVLALFPRLGERLNSLAGNLSGGEQQMLAIGRALMTGPQVLLLDEPSLGLAPLIVTQILELVERMAWDSGLAVLLVEQNATVALRISRSGVVLNLGEVAGYGTSAELLASEELRHIYLGTG